MTCVDHFRGLTRNASAYSTNSRHQWLGARHTAAIVIRVGKNKKNLGCFRGFKAMVAPSGIDPLT